MERLDFDLRLLLALRALLEEANVTRAAERLGVGQSSMSSTLAKLRGLVGDELLVRVGRDYELTPTAREVLPRVQRTLGEIERALGGDGPFDPRTSTRTFTFMCSDYAALEVRDLLAPLLGTAPRLGFELRSLPARPTDSERDLMTHDFILAVPGIGVDGARTDLFVDHYVCLVDRAHPALRDGRLSWEAFVDLPQAASDFGPAHLTPAARRLRELGLHRPPAVRTAGLVPLPSVVAGTDLVAVVPSRLAARLGPATGTVGVPAPFGEVEIIETLWWHESRETDTAHAWLREQLSGGPQAGSSASLAQRNPMLPDEDSAVFDDRAATR